MSSTAGLRERKKERTRRAIATAARDLFAERGFDTVTVAEVARAADVSEATVFNYFPAKEDLFYSGMDTFEAELVEAVRARAPGESALTAFRRVVLARSDRLATEEARSLIERAGRMISASPALQARERAIVERYTGELAAALAAESGLAADDVEAWAAAGALMGVQRRLVAYVRAEVREGRRGEALVAALNEQAARGFGLLEHGLGDYAVKDS
jgi:AcrR family transcriptional regulator